VSCYFTVTLMIFTSVRGLSVLSVGTFSMFFTVSIPLNTPIEC
jgi:UPF0716 family protein affecting phage T7 exclusion